jgi:hypothetical protein
LAIARGTSVAHPRSRFPILKGATMKLARMAVMAATILAMATVASAQKPDGLLGHLDA